MMIERFDLDTGIEFLDAESIMGVLALTDLWRARARLRARWLMRAALDALPDFHFDQFIACDYAAHERRIVETHDTYSNDMKGSAS